MKTSAMRGRARRLGPGGKHSTKGRGLNETGKAFMPSWMGAAAVGKRRGGRLGLVNANVSGKRKEGSARESHRRKAGMAETQLSPCEAHVGIGNCKEGRLEAEKNRRRKKEGNEAGGERTRDKSKIAMRTAAKASGDYHQSEEREERRNYDRER